MNEKRPSHVLIKNHIVEHASHGGRASGRALNRWNALQCCRAIVSRHPRQRTTCKGKTNRHLTLTRGKWQRWQRRRRTKTLILMAWWRCQVNLYLFEMCILRRNELKNTFCGANISWVHLRLALCSVPCFLCSSELVFFIPFSVCDDARMVCTRPVSAHLALRSIPISNHKTFKRWH